MGLSLTHHVPQPQSWGVKKSPFQIAAKRLEIDDHASTGKKRLIKKDIFWLSSDAVNNRTAFAKASNEWTPIEHSMRGRRAAWPDHHCGDNLV